MRTHWPYVTHFAAALAGMVAALALWPQAFVSAAELLLGGTVQGTTEVSVTPAAGANTLDLSRGTGVTQLKVADVFEASNRPHGYTVSVASGNLAAAPGRCTTTTTPCLYSADGQEDVAFTLFKNGTPFTFSGSTVTWSDISNKNKNGTTADARISYSVATALTAGDYNETLTFTITAK